MKYLVILIFIVLLVRIDWLLRQFEHLSAKLSSRSSQTEVELKTNREIIPLAQDKVIQQSPKEVFLALMEDFHRNPNAEVRTRAINYLKDHPTIFNPTLDLELEQAIFSWRDLLSLNSSETANFLFEMLNYLPEGENPNLIKRFLSIWMDINMEHFLIVYSRSRDTNCSVASMFGDSISDDVKINVLKEREEALKTILVRPGTDPAQMKLANNCLLVVGVVLSKLNPSSDSEESSITISPEPSATGTNP